MKGWMDRFFIPSYLSIKGNSYETGFILDIIDKRPTYWPFYYLEVGKFIKRPERGPVIILGNIYYLSFLLGFCTTIFNHPMLTVALYSLGIITFLLFLLMDFSKNMREWHACEHKSAILLHRGLAPTIENLKACPKTLIMCGTSIITSSAQTAITVSLIWYSSFFRENPIADYVFISSCILLLSRAILTSGLIIQSKAFFKLTAPLTFFSALLPLLIEWIFALREPSQDKLVKTAEGLKQFLDQNPGFTAKSNT